MDFLIKANATVGTPDSKAQFLMAANGIATLMRKDNRIEVPVKGEGQLFAVCEGLPNISTSKLSADITTRALLGFYENTRSASFKMQLCEFVLNSHRKLHEALKKQAIRSHFGSS